RRGDVGFCRFLALAAPPAAGLRGLAAAIAGIDMFSFFSKLFDTSGFPPPLECGATWGPGAPGRWVRILLERAVFSAYIAIPVMLVYFVFRKKTGAFLPIFWLFAVFILACGCVHLIEATLFSHPWYRLSALVKLITAVASVATAAALIP